MFFDELADSSRLLRHELEQALGELVALGLASSDSFGGLRALLTSVGPAQASPRREAARARARLRHRERRPLVDDRPRAIRRRR